jgi:hypothetical protein
MSSLLFLRDSSFFSIFINTTKVVSIGYLFYYYLTMIKDENDLDYIIVSLCRGLADYDANEVQPAGADYNRDSDN